MRQLMVLVVGLALIFAWAGWVKSMRTQERLEARGVAPPPRIQAPATQQLPQTPDRRMLELPADGSHISQASYLPRPAAVLVKVRSLTDVSATLDDSSTEPTTKIQEIVWNATDLKAGAFLSGPNFRLETSDPSGVGDPVQLYRKELATGAWVRVSDQAGTYALPAGSHQIVVAQGTDAPTGALATDELTIHVPGVENPFTFDQFRPGKLAPWYKLQQPISLPQNTPVQLALRTPSSTGKMHLLALKQSAAGKYVIVRSQPMAPQRVLEPTTVPMVASRIEINPSETSNSELTLVPFWIADPQRQNRMGGQVQVDFKQSVTDSVALTLEHTAPRTFVIKPAAPAEPETVTGLASQSIYLVLKAGRLTQAQAIIPGATEWTFNFPELSDGKHLVSGQVFVGDLAVASQVEETLEVVSSGFRVTGISPSDFGSRLGSNTIRIDFSRALATQSLTDIKNAIRLVTSPGGEFALPIDSNSVTLPADDQFQLGSERRTLFVTFASVTAGVYQLTINGSRLTDAFGNLLEGDDGRQGSNVVRRLGTPTESNVAPPTQGIAKSRAAMIEYPEFVAPRQSSQGFNPSDKVETRVARLYFYRDAHRVAQILNRRAESYNRQGVTARRQLADKSRQEAERIGTERLNAERFAVAQANRTRQLERDLSDAQRSLDRSLQELQSASIRASTTDPTLGTDAQQASARAAIARDQQVVGQLENAVRSFADRVQSLETEVRNARDSEIAANEQWLQRQREEQLARTEQFRLETAAAHEDPDTFAAGNPSSMDPVAQVSISVIGEGLLHLRGPLKGINQVRMMIDQIDAPQGQVRVNVHSTQINGDEADQLETVANRIQTYIDQARFLTAQSGEILRKAVVHVAAQRAEQARGMYPGLTQADRDQLYLHAFFGSDFVNELRAMDSELLHTGNKLLALHSMDVTSLSSGLTLLALASNETRLAIMQEFQQLLQAELPRSEAEYLRNGIGCCTGGCKEGCKHHRHAPPLCQFSQNATFTSLRGFFDASLPGDETLSPMQREMIRLAQILKARLVTEMEYKQRVMERAVIEERADGAGSPEDQLRRENNANAELYSAAEAQRLARATLVSTIPTTTSQLDAALASYNSIIEAVDSFARLADRVIDVNQVDARPGARTQADKLYALLSVIDSQRTWRSQQMNKLSDAEGLQPLDNNPVMGTTLRVLLYAKKLAASDGDFDDHVYLTSGVYERAALLSQIEHILGSLAKAQDALRPFSVDVEQTKTEIDELMSGLKRILSGPQLLFHGSQPSDTVALISVNELRQALIRIVGLLGNYDTNLKSFNEVKDLQATFEAQFLNFLERSKQRSVVIADISSLLKSWSNFRIALQAIYQESNNIPREIIEAVEATNRALAALSDAFSKLDAAQSLANESKRPLDHKKFLDMLIDDLEEKQIELLEGTRAHTANIDNYLKRLTTALDDDFNTQFYYPAFRLVRQASQFKGVEFGQTETTNVLANNRAFAKVSPSASMEFDLPKRDILIKEGLDSALAIYNDVGALVNDPNLLALAKLGSGQSVASPGAGTLDGFGTVRNVLPGLQSDSAEQVLARTAGSGPQFDSSVEKLIPDPAIYKFETGTGYEIRPVIAPDGQAVVFDFHYLYTTQIREPVRADEKHLGRVKQHLIDTDVQLSNFELREVSRYTVALKAERTANGVPLLEDIPLVGALWRPLPNREKSLQQNIVMAQATIFPTLFDLMGLRWAQAVSDVDPLHLSNREYLVRGRHQYLENRIYDYSSNQVDEFLRIPADARRADLYRSQATIPSLHPNGYQGPGLDRSVSNMQEGYDPRAGASASAIPNRSSEGRLDNPSPPYQTHRAYPGTMSHSPVQSSVQQSDQYPVVDPQYSDSLPPPASYFTPGGNPSTGTTVELIEPIQLESSSQVPGSAVGRLPPGLPRTDLPPIYESQPLPGSATIERP